MLVPTLRSVARAAAVASTANIEVEVVIVLDRATKLTTDIAHEFSPRARVISINDGDLGIARNAGIAATAGEWVALVDGDDLWGPSWISAAFNAGSADARKVIWHPQYSVYFETNEHIYEHIDSEDDDFDVNFLLTANYWTSAAFSRRSTFVDCPYYHADRKSMFGYEDWNWNCRTIEAGYIHKVAVGSVHFIRRRERSMSRAMVSSNAMCIPHTLFRSLRMTPQPKGLS